MWFSRTSFEISISATVFYWTFFASECLAGDIPGIVWNNDDGSIHIYRTEIPWKPINLDAEKNSFAVVAWIAVLSVTVSVAAIVCLCCLCWKFYPKYSSRRQSSNAALVPNAPTTVVTFQTDHDVDMGIRNSTIRTGSVYSTGVVNLAFVNSRQDLVPTAQLEDGPPAYSTVISQSSPNEKTENTPYPRVSEVKMVETPPPAYITVAPFQ